LENHQKAKGYMIDLKDFYCKQIANHKIDLSSLKRRSLILSMSRLLVFLGMILGGYLAYPNGQVVTGVILGGFVLFLILVNRYANVKSKRNFADLLVKINEHEVESLQGNNSRFAKGEEFLDGHHFYNQDIDLFGEGSLFQMLNRCGTSKGYTLLADQLNSNDIERVEEKQKAVAELSSKVDWRQSFQATGLIIEKEVNADEIIKWVLNYKEKIPRVFKWMPIAFSILSLAAIGLYSFGFIHGLVLGVWFFVGLGLTSLKLSAITKLAGDGGKVQETISQYGRLISAIENEKFESPYLNEVQQKLSKEDKKVSEVLGSLAYEFSRLDQRNNVFFALLANGFFLWDLRFSFRIENWLRNNNLNIEDWFVAVSEFDAMNSKANFAHNHPVNIYPTVDLSKGAMLNADQLGHPLLNLEKRIDNDFKMNNEDFFIITGANMAGKSTFLRTVALNIVLANNGLPVCAKSFSYRPIKLISSMRTSDSLQNDESYFFSELKRLKFIVDQIAQDTYFIILDEILKGTNSKDKAEGSAKFVERLVSSQSTGLIATHDLSLCVLSEKLPQVENHYFDAEIIDDELHFDYTFKDGVCQNMNASFLLKKMEIV
jgi:hypothetical protein